MVERYYQFRSVEGPKDQIGLALRVNQEGNLIDLTNMLNFKKSGKRTHVANTNVDLWGDSLGEKDLVKFYVREDARLRIRQQPSHSIYLTEISEGESEAIVERISQNRLHRIPKPVRSLTPKSPDLPYYT